MDRSIDRSYRIHHIVFYSILYIICFVLYDICQGFFLPTTRAIPTVPGAKVGVSLAAHWYIQV